MRVVGPYRLLQLLGRGSSGEVWAAERDGTELAVKILHDASRKTEFAEAIRREVTIGELVAGLDGVVAVRRVEELQGALFLESEWVRGPNLEQVLAGRLRAGLGPIPPSVAVSWGVALLRTLDEVARRVAPRQPQTFLHRDIKPANVLLDPAGRVRITDFGIARAETKLGFQTTATGTVKGSPRFMAPEVILDRNPDARADQFSVGALLFELLTGEPLNGGRDLVSVITLATSGRVDDRLAKLDAPPGLVAVIRAMVQRERHDRYPGAREAAIALGSQLLPGPTPAEVAAELLQHAVGPDYRGVAPSAETTMALPAVDDTTEEEHAADQEDTLVSEPGALYEALTTLDPDDEETVQFEHDDAEAVAVRAMLEKLRRG